MSKSVTVEMLDSSRLYADPVYQAAPRARTERIISREYKAALFGVPEVAAEEDGRFAILDGQTRILVARRLGVLPTNIWCRVHRGLTLPEKALLFVEMNENKTNVHTVKKYLSSLIAEDKDCLAIDQAVRAQGLAVGMSTTTTRISAVDALRALHKDGTLTRVLAICRQWAQDFAQPVALSGPMLRNVSQFLSEQKVNDKTLTERLASKDPRLVLAQIRGERQALSGSLKASAVGRVFKKIYTGKNL